ncbi:MAG: excinuclease ABC subunit UvrA [Gammaproteobacteria bacterium]
MSVSGKITVKGARQHNLKSVDLTLNTGEMTVITGVSGSGKSTLAFDTLYAEGQRRYVETFSAYARQFLDRMDKPAVDEISGIPPAIAIKQSNPVRTSRSTVGTMTELLDYIKILYARFSLLYCRTCGQVVTADNPQHIANDLFDRLPKNQLILVCAPIPIPHNFTLETVRQLLAQQGYTRIHRETDTHIEAIQDRLRLQVENRSRLLEALENALKRGQKQVYIYPIDDKRQPLDPIPYSSRHHCARCNHDYPLATPGLFSFNSPVGACETCRGFGRVIGVDYARVIPDHTLSLQDGAIKPFQTPTNREVQALLMREAKRRHIPTTVPWKKLSAAQKNWVIDGEAQAGDSASQHHTWFGIRGFFQWWESKAYKMHVRVLLSKYRSYETCHACNGSRLKPEALLWRLSTHRSPDRCDTLNIAELLALPICDALSYLTQLTDKTTLDEAAQVLRREIQTRLKYLMDVGLGYLTLDRQTRTLSGGEVQRINLTTALGSSLVHTLIVLDEPSIGLHSRDVARLIQVLHRLRAAGNTVLVVEHDPQVMLSADRIIDMGPGPGQAGGRIVFHGTPSALLKNTRSLTAQYLRRDLQADWQHPHSSNPQTASAFSPQGPSLCVMGAAENNLQRIDVRIPLHGLVCLAGVSGSGKSTLLHDILYPALRQKMGKPEGKPGAFHRLSGVKHLHNVVLVDQSPLAKSTRSVPVTVVGAFDLIRTLFAAQPLAKQYGYKPGAFSFNAGTGRCPSCLGNGFECVEMQFLSDVYLRCPDCAGRRYRPEILAVKIPGSHDSPPRSISDVLNMTVQDAIVFFQHMPELVRRLQPLLDVGLGYVQLDQPVPTLSGGESQRLKLATHLAQVKTEAQGQLFLFDEPTTGLHFDDIKRLLAVFQRLVDAGHSLLVIEHNLDVLAVADWLIELGPEGGAGGGQIVATGTPRARAHEQKTATGIALANHLIPAQDHRHQWQR